MNTRDRYTMRHLITAIAFLLTLFMGAVAFADTPGVKVKEIKFEEDHIPGDVMIPDMSETTARSEDDLVTLVRARENFTDEMIKAVEDL